MWATVDGQSVQLLKDKGGYGYSAYPPAPWAPGATLSGTMGGSPEDVPAFITTVKAPPEITVTAPVIPAGTPLSHSKASDLVVSWSGGAEGTVEVQLITLFLAPNESLSSVTCRAPVAAGTLTVPAAALGMIDAQRAILTVANTNESLEEKGDWTVGSRASETGLAGAIEFQ